ITNVKLLNLCLPAHSAASQIDPSLHSPSPTITKTRWPACSYLAFTAKPTPMGKPCPKLPVEASTPGTLPSGCPPKIPLASQNFHNSSSGKKPLSCKTTYNARHPCPLLKMQRSRSLHFGLRTS